MSKCIESKSVLHHLSGASEHEFKSCGELFDQIVFSDGPNGLRFQGEQGDHLGLLESEKATCFPTSSALSNTWNPNLVNEITQAMAKEAIHFGVDVVLGPGVNIKRNSLCGRNFEYFSEDPLLTIEMAVSYINGLQDSGIGASLKHFLGNEQESYRLTVDTIIGKRAKEEIYLKVFEDVIKRSDPWTVMNAYNLIDGTHCAENRNLLIELLRDNWGYDGAVISDWFSVSDLPQSIENGLDLEMPFSGEHSVKELEKALADGTLSNEATERAISNLTKLSKRCNNEFKKTENKVDFENHHELARKAASESIVLLKNDRDVLPLKTCENILFIGSRIEMPNIQGDGSSHVNPMFEDKVGDFISEYNGGSYKYVKGYEPDQVVVDSALVEEVLLAAKDAETLVLFSSLLSHDEAESYDRADLNLPECQQYLIQELVKLDKNIVLVLETGCAIEIPQVDELDAIIQANLSGQGQGKAIADVLFGHVNPSGKLAETYPLKLAHTPAFLFRTNEKQVTYNEGIFVGYRYYDKKELPVLFPFGHGLSYTKFEYSNFTCSNDNGDILVSLVLKNVGDFAGSEVVQLYVGLNERRAIQPIKQLRKFNKVYLKPGQSEKITFKMSAQDFRYFDEILDGWTYATGLNNIYIGSSSRDIRYSSEVDVDKFDYKYPKITKNTTAGELFIIPELQEIISDVVSSLKEGSNINEDDLVNKHELENSIKYMALRNIVQVTKGEFSPTELQGLIDIMNHHLSRANLLNNKS